MFSQKYMTVNYLGYLLRPIKSLSMNRLESIIIMELFQQLSLASADFLVANIRSGLFEISPETLGQIET